MDLFDLMLIESLAIGLLILRLIITYCAEEGAATVFLALIGAAACFIFFTIFSFFNSGTEHARHTGLGIGLGH